MTGFRITRTIAVKILEPEVLSTCALNRSELPPCIPGELIRNSLVGPGLGRCLLSSQKRVWVLLCDFWSWR